MDSTKSSQYVRIDPRFCLRGWEGQPYSLLDTRTAVAHPISEGVFGTLRLCNGHFRPIDPLFLGPRRIQLDLLDREGVLTFSPEPSSLEPEQEYLTYPNHYMREVQWSLTGRCNYRCRHCYMDAPNGILPQPTTEQCLSYIDQMAEAGVQVVKITGGEPLIRPDFLQIVDHLYERHIPISTILTNGALLDEKLIVALEERGVICGFDISFDGVGGWHDWLRGVEGAEESAIRAFRLLREHGFPAGAQYVLHRGNVGVLRESMRLLGELGVVGVIIGSVRDQGAAGTMRDQILSYDEIFDIACDYLPQFLEDDIPLQEVTIGDFFRVRDGKVSLLRGENEHPDCAGKPACNSVVSTLYLSPDGYILPCIPASHDDVLKESFPNIADMTISEALHDSVYLDRVLVTVGDVLDRNPECRACPWANRCLGGCRVKALGDDGKQDYLGMDRRSCTYFKDGYYERARAFVEQLRS